MPRQWDVVMSVRFDEPRPGVVLHLWPAATLMRKLQAMGIAAYNPNKVDKQGKCKDDECWRGYNRCSARNFKNGKPADDSCWRQSFFWHLQHIKRANMPMLQLVEDGVLGEGQKIELAMAQHLQVRVLRMDIKKSTYSDRSGLWIGETYRDYVDNSSHSYHESLAIEKQVVREIRRLYKELNPIRNRTIRRQGGQDDVVAVNWNNEW